MDCIYITLSSKELHILCLTFTHSHTVSRGNHAGCQPAQRQSELVDLLKNSTTDIFPRMSWTLTTNLSLAGWGLYHLSQFRHFKDSLICSTTQMHVQRYQCESGATIAVKSQVKLTVGIVVHTVLLRLIVNICIWAMDIPRIAVSWFTKFFPA